MVRKKTKLIVKSSGVEGKFTTKKVMNMNMTVRSTNKSRFFTVWNLNSSFRVSFSCTYYDFLIGERRKKRECGALSLKPKWLTVVMNFMSHPAQSLPIICWLTHERTFAQRTYFRFPMSQNNFSAWNWKTIVWSVISRSRSFSHTERQSRRESRGGKTDFLWLNFFN